MNAPQVQFDPESARFGASRSQKRLEDDRLLVGLGRFSDDRRFDNEAALVVTRSPHAHARIRAVNLDAARAAPGVLAAWTMAELAADGVKHLPTPPLFKRADGQPMSAPLRTPLAQDRALYVGHPVVAVVAATRAQAQDAADLVEIDYEDLPCVVDARDAVAQGAPVLWDGAPGNVAAETRYGRAAAATAAFERAAHITEVDLHNQRLVAMAMEPRCAIAVHEGGRTTVYTQSQQPTGARDLLAAAFGAKAAEFRVVNGDIGGGFGMKTGAIPEEVLVAYAARKLGRPVRWRGERSEEFLAAHMGRDMHFKAALALDRDGRFLALRLHSLGNMGAVPVGSSAMIPLMMVAKVVTSVYRVPEVDYHFQGVLTNTMATGAYRGAGRPEGNYLMERLVEKAAREMKIDPAEIRRRNLLQPGDFPYTTHAGEVYDAGDFPRMLQGLLRLADWDGYAARAAESRRRGRLRGRGLSMYLEWTGALPTETVDIEIDAEGRVTVFSGTQAMGQGLETSYVQLVTEVLQVAGGERHDRAGRHRPRQRRGQRRLALGVRRRLRRGGRGPNAHRARARARGRDARDRGRGPRVPRRPRVHRRHRPLGVARRARVAAGRAPAARLGDPNALDAVVAERRAGLRGGGRCGHGRGDARAPDEHGRHRPHHQSHDRRGADPGRHGAGRRPGAVRAGGVRPRTAGSCSPAR